MKYIALAFLLSLSACTDNKRARTLGGTMNVALPPNAKLVNATWKNEEVWFLHRPMRPGESPETTTFQEKSGFGLVEGKVVFTESKK